MSTPDSATLAPSVELRWNDDDGTPRHLVIDHAFLVFWMDQFGQVRILSSQPELFNDLLAERMTLDDWEDL